MHWNLYQILFLGKRDRIVTTLVFLHLFRVMLLLLNIIGELIGILHSNLIVIILAWFGIYTELFVLEKRDLIVSVLAFLHSFRVILLLLNITWDLTRMLHSNLMVIILTWMKIYANSLF